MRLLPLLLAILLTLPTTAQIDRNAVHNVLTVDSMFAEWDAAYPEFVERITIGQSEGGFPLHGIIVTDESVAFDDPPHTAANKWRIYLDGGHHGNEFLGVEIGLYYLESLLDNAASGDEATLALLQTTEIQMVPILNVEGNLRDTRINLNGVDPNRNYDFGHTPCSIPGLTCGGPEPFSESEILANAEHVAAISPDLWLSMHTGIEVLYYPAGDPFPNQEAVDQPLFTAMEAPFEAATAGRIDMVGGPAPAVGSAEDWGYATLGINSFVYEVHDDQNLPVYGEPITNLLQDQINGMAYLVEGAPRWGAWIELELDGASFRVVNRGLGEARNVTITSSEQELVIDSIAGDSSCCKFPVPKDGKVEWTYPTLLVDGSRERTHNVDVGDDAKATPVGLLLAIVMLAAFAARRRH